MLEYGAVALLAALGVALSILAFLHLSALVTAERRKDLETHAVAHAESLAVTLAHHDLLANAMAGLFSSDRPLTRADFQAFAARLGGSLPGLQAVAWLPRIAAGDRRRLEAVARDEGLADFTIRPGPGGERLQPESFPVYFIEPMQANEAALGVDAASLQDRQRALQEARDEGRATATGRLRLVQADADDSAVILFTPVYAGGYVPHGLIERRKALKGFVAISIDLGKLMRVAVKAGSEVADIYVFDEGAPAGSRLLYWRAAPMAGEMRRALAEDAVMRQPHIKRGLDVGGRSWSLLLLLGGTDEAPLMAWASLAGGLLLTTLLSAVSLGTISRRRRAEVWAAAIGRSNESLWREIAERRQIETTLRQAENRLEMALKSVPLSLFAQDRELRYTWLFKSRLGLTQEEVLGRTDFEVMAPQDAVVLAAIKRRVLDSGIGIRQEVSLEGRGRAVVLDIVVEPIFQPDGTISGVIGTAIDITREREVQAQLEKARAEAERANEAKSRFLAAASHDLRQPLQATRLFLEVLGLKLRDHPALAVAEKAMTAVEATNGLLNSLLDISTLEAGVVTPDVTEFPLARMIDRLAAETLPQAEAAGLAFRAVRCGLWVRTDGVLLERMIRNLIANALRYTQQGKVLLGCRRVGGGVRIEVVDTGPGIPPDKFEVIFEDFVQLGNPERDRSRGLGLGLSVVQRTAMLLGHRVGLRSTPGRGSAFWIEIAEVVPPPTARPAPALADEVGL